MRIRSNATGDARRASCRTQAHGGHGSQRPPVTRGWQRLSEPPAAPMASTRSAPAPVACDLAGSHRDQRPASGDTNPGFSRTTFASAAPSKNFPCHRFRCRDSRVEGLANPRATMHYSARHPSGSLTRNHRMPLVDPVIERVLAEFERRAEEEQRRTAAPGSPGTNLDDLLLSVGREAGMLALSTRHGRAVAAHPRARHFVRLLHRVAGRGGARHGRQGACRSSSRSTRSSTRARR